MDWLLNGNLLEGQVPDELYSIGVHGGAIDLSANKGLCGVPSLPACPMRRRNDYDFALPHELT
ncbi:leucine-rich repeat receptor-like serine/threonine-protein kinase, partial [Trifolium medium]|nr:leucine-rich repeat receptor-like serine/threonine-protein kinase [Trifolium medium]